MVKNWITVYVKKCYFQKKLEYFVTEQEFTQDQDDLIQKLENVAKDLQDAVKNIREGGSEGIGYYTSDGKFKHYPKESHN